MNQGGQKKNKLFAFAQSFFALLKNKKIFSTHMYHNLTADS